MRITTYVDADGRKWLVELPDGVPDGDASMGLHIGPVVNLEPLGLPHDVEVRLHNELFARNLLTGQDVRAHRSDLVGAIQSALKLSGERIYELYLAEEKSNAVEEPKPIPREARDKVPRVGRRRK